MDWTTMESMVRRLLERSDHLIRALFDPEEEKEYAWLGFLWLGALFAAGIYLFGVFFNRGVFTVDFHDWAEISAPRLAFLQDAVLKGVLPLHMPDASALRGVTDRFMSIPDVLLSPQILLMRYMDIRMFMYVDILIFYSIGFIGLLKIRKKFSLSLFVTAVLFFLFNFNGHILSHLSVGHASWGGYFLFPWFVLLVFQLLEGDHSWRWVTLMAGLMLLIFLQGSFHHFIWGLFFLGFLGLASWGHFPQVMKAIVFALLVSMVRILPPILEMAKFDTEYLGGYPTIMHLLKALTTIVPPQELSSRSPLTVLGWWEFDLHAGLIGTAFVLVFGLLLWLQNRHQEQGYHELLFPIGIISLFTIGNIYRLVTLLPIPLIAGERVTSRMIILPFTFILILGAIQAQNWYKNHSGSLALRLGGLGILMILMHDMWQYIRLWRIEYVKDYFPVTPVDLSIKVVANHDDPIYITVLLVGTILSLGTLLFLGFMTWREYSNKKQQPET
jgi:hypothetical protein